MLGILHEGLLSLQGQWQLVLDHYLPIPLSHIFNQLKEDLCQRVDLVIWVHRKTCMYLLYYVNPWEKTERPGDIDYHPNVSEIEFLPILD